MLYSAFFVQKGDPPRRTPSKDDTHGFLAETNNLQPVNLPQTGQTRRQISLLLSLVQIISMAQGYALIF